jgi:TonB family protein
MKSATIGFLIILFSLNNNIFAQTNMASTGFDSTTCAAHDTTVQLVVEKNAKFQNGDILKFRTFVMSMIRMPLEAMINKYQGKSIIKFTVDWDGQVKDVSVLKSSGYKILDNEAVRVIKKSPVWTSAKVNNICVPQQFFLPIEFRNYGVIGTQY